jgi:hypothetical protein
MGRGLVLVAGAAIALAAGEMRIDTATAERGWRDFTTRRILPQDLAVSLPGMVKVLDIMARAGSIKTPADLRPEKYLDLSFLLRARRSAPLP